MVAQLVELALPGVAGFAVVGVAGTIAEAVPLAEAAQPDVVLLDFHLPDGDGAQAAVRIRAASPRSQILVLSADESEDALESAVEAGACGYVLKRAPVEDLGEAIRGAAAGEMLVPGPTLARLMVRRRERAAKEAERERIGRLLSPREREVLALVARGLGTEEMAEALFISSTTLRGHVQNVLEKLEVHSKLEAVVKAGELGLLG